MLLLKKHYASLESSESLLYEITNEDIEQLHKILLKMYDDLYAYCQKHSLKLIASGGTALGAVRHKGFIPWDDDMDLNLIREDYQSFLIHFEEELGDKYDLLAPGYKKGANCFLMRVMRKNTTLKNMIDENSPYPTGIYCDLYPLDYAPDNRFLLSIKAIMADSLRFISYSVFWKKYRSPSLKQYMLNSEGKTYYRFRIVVGTIFSFSTPEKWFERYDKFIQGKESNHLTIAAGRKYYKGETQPTEVFLPVKQIPFEDRQIYMENDSDTYLKNLYGDYMKIPDEKDREKHLCLRLDFKSGGK